MTTGRVVGWGWEKKRSLQRRGLGAASGVAGMKTSHQRVVVGVVVGHPRTGVRLGGITGVFTIV